MIEQHQFTKAQRDYLSSALDRVFDALPILEDAEVVDDDPTMPEWLMDDLEAAGWKLVRVRRAFDDPDLSVEEEPEPVVRRPEPMRWTEAQRAEFTTALHVVNQSMSTLTEAAQTDLVVPDWCLGALEAAGLNLIHAVRGLQGAA